MCSVPEEKDQVRFVSPCPWLPPTRRLEDSVHILIKSAGARLVRTASPRASGAMSKVRLVSLLAHGEGATFHGSGGADVQIQQV